MTVSVSCTVSVVFPRACIREYKAPTFNLSDELDIVEISAAPCAT